MSPAAAWTELAGRTLIASLFLAGVAQKLVSPQGARELLALAGLPGWLIWPAILFTGAAGLAVLLGVWVRPFALALAGYCIVTSYFHYLIGDPWQMTIVAKNWTIAGGCLILAANGAGPMSFDKKARRKS